jgi:hypothetical protein
MPTPHCPRRSIAFDDVGHNARLAGLSESLKLECLLTLGTPPARNLCMNVKTKEIEVLAPRMHLILKGLACAMVNRSKPRSQKHHSRTADCGDLRFLCSSITMPCEPYDE